MLQSFKTPKEGNVLSCNSLSPAHNRGTGKPAADRLAAAGLTKITSSAYRPLGMLGNHIIVRGGNCLYAFHPDDMRSVMLCSLDAGTEILTALPYSDGKRLVITTNNDYVIVTDLGDSEFACAAVPADDAAMPYFATEEGTVQAAQVRSRELSKAYTDNGEVRTADANALTSDLVDAYRQIANRSNACGDFLQPCLVRYRLLDSAGCEIYTSPRVLVGSAQACEAVRLQFADSGRTSVLPYSVSGTGTVLKLHIFPSAKGIRALFASRLEVLVSPALQPYQPRASADCRRAVGGVSGDFAVLRLPGCAYGQFSPCSGSSERMLRLLMASGRERVAAVIDNPFGGVGERVIDIKAPALSIEREISDLKSVVNTPVEAVSSREAYLSAPHRIAARVTATASGVMLASGLTVNRFRGYELSSLAFAGSGTEPWRAVVTTIFSDGSRLSMPCEGESNAPLTVSPVVTCPAPDVASVAIQLHVQGSPLRVMSLQMTEDASHRQSVYVAPGLKPPVWREVDGVLTVPDDTAQPITYDTAVVACPHGSLLSVSAVTHMQSRVNALQPAARSMGAWDFGRARFLCGGDGGIHALTVNAERTRIASNLLHPGAVPGQDSMTQALDGDVAAIASGDLITIGGSTVTTRIAAVGDGIVSCNPATRRLWLVAGDRNRLMAVSPDNSYRGFTLPLPEQPYALVPCSGKMWMFGASGVYSFDTPLAGGVTVGVTWSCLYPGPWSGRLRLVVPLSATWFDGSVTVLHGHLSAGTAVISRHDVCGSVNSPLLLSVSVPPCDALTVKIEGTVSADFTLGRPELLMQADFLSRIRGIAEAMPLRPLRLRS